MEKSLKNSKTIVNALRKKTKVMPQVRNGIIFSIQERFILKTA